MKCSKCNTNPRLSYHSYCGTCHSLSVKQSNKRTGYRSSPSTKSRNRKQPYNSAYYKKRYTIIIQKLDDYKIKMGCKDCGYKQFAAGLEFDHLPEYEKKCSPTTLAGRGWKSVEEEIKKCEVVCGTCHNIRTWKRRSGSA